MLSHTLTRVAVIGDVVGSRRVQDRRHLQESLDSALALATLTWKPTEALTPTVGDEFQGVFDNLSSALTATLFIRVSMPTSYDVRFGIGVGPVTWAEARPAGPRLATDGFRRQDGPAWWVARAAIDHVARGGRGRSVPGTLRTWIAVVDRDLAGERADAEYATEQRIVALNAYLALRDHLVTRMDARDRRILQRLMLGWQIAEIADAESVTSSAISQRVQRSGAAEIMYTQEQLLVGFLRREGGG